MKKSQRTIITLAEVFQNKYAAQSLQDIIESAAAYGEGSANRIMNFPAKLREDGADLSINVNITNGNVSVSQPTVSPPQFAVNYARLTEQIRNYLERHLRDFSLPQGITTLRYFGRNGATTELAQE